MLRATRTKAGHRVQQPGCQAPYAWQYCPPAARGQRAGLLCAAQLSAQALFYHYFHCFITFLGIQISVTALDAPGEKWCLPPPSSFNLMNCLFSYQRVMSTKPHNIYSWNKRQRAGGGGGKQKQSLGVERRKAGCFKGAPPADLQ